MITRLREIQPILPSPGTLLQLSEPAQRLHLAHEDAEAVPSAGRGLPDERLPAVAQTKVNAVHRPVRNDAGNLVNVENSSFPIITALS